MIFYEFVVEYEEEKISGEEAGKTEDRERTLGNKLNRKLRVLKSRPDFVYAYVCRMEEGRLDMVLAVKAEMGVKRVWKVVLEILCSSMGQECRLARCEEITVGKFKGAISDGDCSNLLRSERRIVSELKLDFDTNGTFRVAEKLYSAKRMSLQNAQKRATEILAGGDFLEELQRIYSKDNLKMFVDHPVHYHLTAGSDASANEMLELLIASLQNNKRLLSGRVNHVIELSERCYDELDFEHMVKSSHGGCVVLPLNYEASSVNEYATSYNEVVSFVGKMVNKYHRKVLFIFVEIFSKQSYAKALLNEVCDDLRIVELSEGTGDRAQAKSLFEKLVKKSEYRCLWEKGEEEKLALKDSYRLSDIYEFYDDWVKKSIYQKAYISYGIQDKVRVKEDKEAGTAYKKLQRMIGLSDIKQVTAQILAMHRMEKMRFELGMEKQRCALHMIFTGNPGSAKTTVARLLAELLYEEGLIQNPRLVECGRAELVGKYVGWTANMVKRKFKEARGGVLFIDEAYSLVEERSGSFGDEAINTIVQEMENMRSEVIVIFAGYPDKMKSFLDKNEGLRSRISFHLDFPDYNTEEMLAILKLMSEERGYVLKEEALEKCRTIFTRAVLQKEFGNGRYARNLLEQAVMKQSRRLMGSYNGKMLSREEMQLLLPEDFDAPALYMEKKCNIIGFCSA